MLAGILVLVGGGLSVTGFSVKRCSPPGVKYAGSVAEARTARPFNKSLPALSDRWRRFGSLRGRNAQAGHGDGPAAAQNQLNSLILLLRASTISLAEESSENKRPSKQEIDRPSDFKFHLAYEAYSKAWDQTSSDSVRAKLNGLISALAKDENGYTDFYAQIQEYRRDVNVFRPGRTRIETQRKRDWQRTETRDGRNRRHK